LALLIIEVWTGYGRKSQIDWETEGTIIIKAVKER